MHTLRPTIFLVSALFIYEKNTCTIFELSPPELIVDDSVWVQLVGGKVTEPNVMIDMSGNMNANIALWS